MEDLLQALRRPFHPTEVAWKPSTFNEERTRALAVAYADLRTYQNRLDEVCGLEWSVTYTPWGERVICHLTIRGITRSSTGEPDSEAERNEIAGTAAEAQSFKRACAMFGLGRYLYNLPSLWVDYDPKRLTFTESAQSQLDALVQQHYQTWLAEHGEQPPAPSARPQLPTEPPPEKASEPPTPAANPLAELRRQLEELGAELYGEQWESVRQRNTERVSQGTITDTDQLTAEHLQKLINGLQTLKRKRATPPPRA
jgi:hypothetical protein